MDDDDTDHDLVHASVHARTDGSSVYGNSEPLCGSLVLQTS
jgi:hypothetical protein